MSASSKPVSLVSEMFPPKTKWTVADMPDQSGRIALVTGGNTGIGYETCLALLKKGAKVYLAARSGEKAKAAIARLQEAVTGAQIEYLPLDLASFASVRSAGKLFLEKESSLDLLFCSAGVMAPPQRLKTQEGIDLQLGTNAVGHHLLIKLLLPALEQAAANSAKGATRVWITSSSVHHNAPFGGFDARDPERDHSKFYRWGPAAIWNLYGLSKHCNVLDAKAWAERLGPKGIVVLTGNPGNIQTELQRHSLFARILSPIMFYPAHLGAVTQLYAATAPEAAELNGRFLAPWARLGRESKATLDKKRQEDFFAYCEEVTSKL